LSGKPFASGLPADLLQCRSRRFFRQCAVALSTNFASTGFVSFNSASVPVLHIAEVNRLRVKIDSHEGRREDQASSDA
jgi:hypothetical protein